MPLSLPKTAARMSTGLLIRLAPYYRRVMPRRSRPGSLIDTSVGFFLLPIERPQSSIGVGTTRWSFRRDRFRRGSERWLDQPEVGDSHRSECSSPRGRSVQIPTRSPYTGWIEVGGPVFVPCGTYKEWNASSSITQCMKINAYSRKSGWHPSSG